MKFDKGYYCKNCAYLINKQKHQNDKKVLGQDHLFSTRLPYANKKIRDIWMKMVFFNYNSTEDLIKKFQQFEGKTKIKFYRNKSNCYDKMNIRFDEDLFAKNVQGISKIYHEVLLLIKLLQTKPQVKNMKPNYYDLFYTVFKNRKKIIEEEQKEFVDNQYEIDFISLNDVIIPNHHIGRKSDNELLK